MDAVCGLCWALALAPFVSVIALKLYLFWRVRTRRNSDTKQCNGSIVHVAFFHPYCHAGGGGERVLWCSINALLERYSFVRCHVYTGDSATGKEILARARQRFNLDVSDSVKFVHLRSRNLVEASTWPYFTLLGQSIGSVILGMEALLKFTPDLYIDSMGYAFTLPLFRWFGGCRVGCYVHYPTISTDMLGRVSQREAAFNNAAFIARSSTLSAGKLIYYRLFAYVYGLFGRRADVIMVNSSWTKDHIVSLWKVPQRTSVVYPPCDTSGFSSNELCTLPDRASKKHLIVSVAQFRPEKNHALQLRAFTQLLTLLKGSELEVELVLVGGCRNDGDQERVDVLRALARELRIDRHVRFELNASYDKLRQLLCSATIGLHTMVNEHFGIGVVECMAAGSVTLAHDSAGPQMDIVVDWMGKKTGYRSDTVDGYAHNMLEILSMPDADRDALRQHARLSVRRFDDKTFAGEFISQTECLFR